MADPSSVGCCPSCVGVITGFRGYKKVTSTIQAGCGKGGSGSREGQEPSVIWNFAGALGLPCGGAMPRGKTPSTSAVCQVALPQSASRARNPNCWAISTASQQQRSGTYPSVKHSSNIEHCIANSTLSSPRLPPFSPHRHPILDPRSGDVLSCHQHQQDWSRFIAGNPLIPFFGAIPPTDSPTQHALHQTTPRNERARPPAFLL